MTDAETPRTHKPAIRWQILLAFGVAALTLVLAGCGSSSSPTSTSPAAEASATPTEVEHDSVLVRHL